VAGGACRRAEFERETGETRVKVCIDLDGSGDNSLDTGVGFFDHMLAAFSRHGRFDLEVKARGDTHVDYHHVVEDTGICLGAALHRAFGDYDNLNRFGSSFVPMDDALVHVAVDLSGRPYLAYGLTELDTVTIGTYPARLTREFMRPLAVGCGMNLHIRHLAGNSPHHIIEACFKALGRAVHQATRRQDHEGPLSTKGVLGV